MDLFATALDAHSLPAREHTEGRSLLPLAKGAAAGPLRPVACFGQAMQVTNGEWTLARWPPGEENGPLYWYSLVPPAFGASRATGPLTERNGTVAWPTSCAQGKQPSALYHLLSDPWQERNVLARQPEVAARLVHSLVEWLGSVGAPLEQCARLGLR